MNEINSTSQIQQSGTPQTKPVQQQNKPVQFNVNGSIFGDRDGSIDDKGRATITFADFDNALLNQTNGEHTFKDYLGAIIGSAWETAGNFIKNIFMIFNQEGKTPEIDGVKVGTTKDGKVLAHNGTWYKFGENEIEYEHNGAKHIINKDGFIMSMDSKIKEGFNADGTYTRSQIIDGEQTDYTYSDYDVKTNKGTLKSRQTTYDNGAGERTEYENGSKSITMTLRYNGAGLPTYIESPNK